MGSAVDPAASSMEALSHQYRTIAHNLANVNTAGFKRSKEQFSQTLLGQMGSPGESTEAPATGVTYGRAVVDFTQGALVQTGRSLDLGMDGAGFFVVESPEGPRYTRNGCFRTNAQGQLVDFAGRTVAGESGPIIVPSSVSTQRVQVSTDGAVSINGQNIGRLQLVSFDDPKALEPLDGTGFRAPANVQPAAARPAVHQGFQEASNVSAVEELVDLITVTRLYEANVKTITAQDERLKSLLQVAMG